MLKKFTGKIGNNFKTLGAAEIAERVNYNGSGPNAFGGAKKWPCLNVKVSFQVGEEAKMSALATQIENLLVELGYVPEEATRIQ